MPAPGRDQRLGVVGGPHRDQRADVARPPVDDTFGPDWVLDLALSYRLDKFTFTLGAENLLDQYPDEVTTQLATDSNGFVTSLPGDNSNTGLLPYPRDSAPYGFNGRFMYARVNYRW